MGVRLRTGAAVMLAGVLLGCGSADSGQPSADVVLLVDGDTTGAPADVVFAAVPDLLVTVDGTVIYGAPPEFAIQGELLSDVWVQMLSPNGIEAVRSAVDDGAAPATVEELSALAGDDLGSAQFYLPDTYRFRAVEIGPESEFDDPDTPLVPWPDTVSVSLSDAANCITLPEIEVGELFETAAADSAFIDDGVVYGVVAAQDWPGAPC